MDATNPQPPVSVGVATYNRPDGLRRTLEAITGQTYRNLEILVSNNGSTDPRVDRVAREFADRDPRLRYFKHDCNGGMDFNFKFVLQQASGQFFMWAADDDQHDRAFIANCVQRFETSPETVGTVMSEIETVWRAKGLSKRYGTADFDPAKTIGENLKAHFKCLTPHLIYGLHKREAILWVLDVPFFDWFDCYFTTRQLVQGYRVSILRGYVGFESGVDTVDYVRKPFRPRDRAVFCYLPYLSMTLRAVLMARGLSVKERGHLVLRALEFAAGAFVRYERPYRPRQCWFHERISLPLLRKLTRRPGQARTISA